jgi:hypothetical protein
MGKLALVMENGKVAFPICGKLNSSVFILPRYTRLSTW